MWKKQNVTQYLLAIPKTKFKMSFQHHQEWAEQVLIWINVPSL